MPLKHFMKYFTEIYQNFIFHAILKHYTTQTYTHYLLTVNKKKIEDNLS